MWINLKNIQWIKSFQKHSLNIVMIVFKHKKDCKWVSKWHVSWIFLHEPWCNDIFKKFKNFKYFFAEFCENIFKNIFQQAVP